MKLVQVIVGLELALGVQAGVAAPGGNNMIGINVVTKSAITVQMLAELGNRGKVRDIVPQINAVTMQAQEKELTAIRKLPFVAAANPDAERTGIPVNAVTADFSAGWSTWDLDAINVTDFGVGNRTVTEDGSGVFVAVLDTGLVRSWRQYFPQERIAVEYARSFGGGGGDVGNVSSQPNKWEQDQDSHGTHVTSTIIGYSYFGNPINGAAPKATIIPVKVLNQNGSGWSSVIARGIVYVADLKAGPLASSPVVVNMSLGGPSLEPMEQAAIDYAIGKGVIIVASAGNEGAAGMGYPGAYDPVISVAAAGWVGEWPPAGNLFWWSGDVADPTAAADYYIAEFSSRALAGQDLDVAAPGSWIVGPYQTNSGQLSFYFLGGTSMASPHVAGIVALMAQKNPALTAPQAEGILTGTALPLAAGCRDVNQPSPPSPVTICWGGNATGAGLVLADAALAATP